MRIRAISVSLLLFVGCGPGSGGGSVVFSIPEYLAVGTQALTVSLLSERAEVSVSLTQNGVALPTPEAGQRRRVGVDGPGTYKDEVLITLTEPGELVAEVEARLGANVQRLSKTFTVRPSFELVNHVPRSCFFFEPLDVPETTFDCDGVVIDAQGNEVAGRPSAPKTRVLRTEAGTIRWLGDRLKVRRETSDGVSPSVELSDERDWVAASDFAVNDRVVAVARNGTLERVPLDKPADPATPLVAAATSGGVHMVVYANHRAQLLRLCPLTIGATQATVGDCTQVRALFHQRDVSNERRVLVVRDAAQLEVGWLDVFDPGAFTVLHTPSDADPLAGLFSINGVTGSGFHAVLSHQIPARLLVPVLAGREPMPNPNDGSWQGPQYPYAFPSSSDYAWAFNVEAPDAGTWWSRVP